MSAEIRQLADFLRSTPPFDTLDDAALAAASRSIAISYCRAGSVILEAGSHNDQLYIIRSGAVELRLSGEELTAKLTQGACFAYPSLLRGGEVRNQAVALEDTLLYAVPAETFHHLRSAQASFRNFFAEDEKERLSLALKARNRTQSGSLDTVRVSQIIGRSTPISCSPDTSILNAAQIMREHRVSTLAICGSDGALMGIFTDKDIRNRVLAAGRDPALPVHLVMTADPHTLPIGATAGEAMAVMAAGGFRHLPLLGDDGRLSGVLSATDILAHLGNSALDTGLALGKAASSDALIEAARTIPAGFAAMIGGGMQAGQAMRYTSALGEAAHRRAAQLAEEELGPPPVPYALLVFGSLARGEQLIGSDQDNGLLIDDSVTAAGLDYFAQLGTRISDILDAAGFDYCRGGIMAKNANQRLTLNAWQKRYRQWIIQPDGDSLLKATIFFDMRCVHGAADLAQQLHSDTVRLAAANPIFTSFVARDALRSTIPLGIFRHIMLEKSSDGEKFFDAKARAIMPVIDIARTISLASGVEAVSTLDRLDTLANQEVMARDDASSLKDAFLFVNELRITHQAAQVQSGQEPDNAIDPGTLSSLEREHLKDVFSVIRNALDSLRRNYAGGIT